MRQRPGAGHFLLPLGRPRRRSHRIPRAHQVHACSLYRARIGDPRTSPVQRARDHRLADRAGIRRVPELGRGRDAPLSSKWLFTLVGMLAALAGTALWLATRPAGVPGPTAPEVSTAAVMAAGFRDLQGASRSLGEFQGKVVVLNFWATWCPPCREEMPAFSRLQAAWAPRRVQFVGLSSEEPARVAAFARSLDIAYPLWVGGDEVEGLSRRLGNITGALPHTVVLDASGRVVAAKVGAYSEAALRAVLENATSEFPQK